MGPHTVYPYPPESVISPSLQLQDSVLRRCDMASSHPCGSDIRPTANGFSVREEGNLVTKPRTIDDVVDISPSCMVHITPRAKVLKHKVSTLKP